jgi:hypothetical protein
MHTSDIYQKLVEKAILNHKKGQEYVAVRKLECLYSSISSQGHYAQVLACVTNGNLNNLKELKIPERGNFNEYLELYSFSDLADYEYLAAIYDSDELWQDPQVIDVFVL